MISDHLGLEVTWLGGQIVKLTSKLNSAASNCVDLIPILKKLIGDHFDLEVTWPRALEVKTEVRFELCMANIVGNDTSNDKMPWLIKKLVHGHVKHAVWSQCINRQTQMTSEVKTEITIGFGTVKLVELDTLNSSQRPFWNLACWHACQDSHMTCYKPPDRFIWISTLSIIGLYADIKHDEKYSWSQNWFPHKFCAAPVGNFSVTSNLLFWCKKCVLWTPISLSENMIYLSEDLYANKWLLSEFGEVVK